MSEAHTVRFWKIEEAVGRGLFMLLDGIYTTQESAIEHLPDPTTCRAQEYERGYDAPRRVTT